MGINNNQSFFIEEISQYDIIDESYSIMYKDMRNWHNLQLAIYECVLNEGNIINFIKDIIHKIIETLKKWWKNITDFIKKVINNIKSKLSNRDRENKLLKLDSSKLDSISGKVEIEIPIYIKKYVYSNGFELLISNEEILIDNVYDLLSDYISMTRATRANNNTFRMDADISETINRYNNDLDKYINNDLGMNNDFIEKHDISSSMNINKRLSTTMKNDISCLQKLNSKIDQKSEMILKMLNNFKNTPISNLHDDPEYTANVIKNNYLKFSELVDKFTKIITERVSKISSAIVGVHNKIDSYYDNL